MDSPNTGQIYSLNLLLLKVYSVGFMLPGKYFVAKFVNTYRVL